VVCGFAFIVFKQKDKKRKNETTWEAAGASDMFCWAAGTAGLAYLLFIYFLGPDS
jgi:hypothetical protein